MVNVHIRARPQNPVDELYRALEDLSSTLPLFADCARNRRPLHPPSAVLQRLGEGLLERGTDDTIGLSRVSGFEKIVNTWAVPFLNGSVRLSYLLISIMLSRSDVRDRIMQDGRCDWETGLRWLVLHGIEEMQLWPFLTTSFVADLRKRSVRAGRCLLSPLEILLLQERPELISRPLDDRPQQIQDALADWLINRGVTEYNLFWALSASELAGVARKRRGQTRSNARVVHQGGAESPGHPGLRAARSPGAAYKAPALSNLNQYCFGSEYPCISLDVDDPLWAAQAISAGKSRQGATSGVELLSPHIAIRYPTKMNAPSVVLLEFLVPEVFDDKLHIGLNIGSQSHKIRSNSESNRHVVKLISEPSFPPAPLEIEFVSDFAKGRTKSYIGIAFGLIKSLRVWQIERSV